MTQNIVENHRSKALENWLSAQLTNSIRLDPLPVEASSRRFFRVHHGAQTLMAMDAPPAVEDNEQFVLLARVFADAGVPVPTVVAYEPDEGFLLVSDFGSRHLLDVYNADKEAPGAGTATDKVLTLAIDSLIRIQNVEPKHIPPYTSERFYDELGIFTQWLTGGLLSLSTPGYFDQASDALVSATQEQPQVPVHRDYHSRNLMLCEDGTLGIVDFQDALVGPLTYDLVSLLRDCYFQHDQTTIRRFQTHYLQAAELQIDEVVFQRWFDLTGIQRHLKAAGIFARLYLRDGRASHLADIPPVLHRLSKLTAQFDETASLSPWLAEVVIPAAERAIAQTDTSRST